MAGNLIGQICVKSIDVTGMPAEYTINKWYRCRVCPLCSYILLSGQSACIDKYYNKGKRK